MPVFIAQGYAEAQARMKRVVHLIFLISPGKPCGYSLEAPQPDNSNEYYNICYCIYSNFSSTMTNTNQLTLRCSQDDNLHEMPKPIF